MTRPPTPKDRLCQWADRDMSSIICTLNLLIDRAQSVSGRCLLLPPDSAMGEPATPVPLGPTLYDRIIKLQQHVPGISCYIRLRPTPDRMAWLAYFLRNMRFIRGLQQRARDDYVILTISTVQMVYADLRACCSPAGLRGYASLLDDAMDAMADDIPAWTPEQVADAAVSHLVTYPLRQRNPDLHLIGDGASLGDYALLQRAWTIFRVLGKRWAHLHGFHMPRTMHMLGVLSRVQ